MTPKVMLEQLTAAKDSLEKAMGFLSKNKLSLAVSELRFVSGLIVQVRGELEND
jgi:acetyl-CoA carboxylase beta subunit